MDNKDLEKLLNDLQALPNETELVEFKEANTGYDFNGIGQYFSALSNEANLKGKEAGWLIFGVENKNHQIVGTKFRPNRPHLDRLKHEIADRTTNRITFREIYELTLPQGRVVMFQIPAAPLGIPTAWSGHCYGREGESICALSTAEFEEIRAQSAVRDWSAELIADFSPFILDPDAIAKARVQFKKKNPHLADEVDLWDDVTFLRKVRMMVGDGITRAAIILLGKHESSSFLSPTIPQISWILKDGNNVEKDYEHFGLPLLLAVEKVFAKIRNLNYRYMPNATLFPVEVTQYDPWVMREALHNCIAHQDYLIGGRINVVEMPERLVFTNQGHFMPGSVEVVIMQDAPQETYRNPCLAQAMVNLNMIDTIGSGIRRMFETQRKRRFPLPDYDLSDLNRVIVRIEGRILDENYTRILIEKTDLDLSTVMLLDKVQKRIKISKVEHQSLKSRGLVEGRYPAVFVSARIAMVTGRKAEHIKNKGLDDAFYIELVIQLLTKHGEVPRRDIDELLIDKLPAVMTQPQKQKKVQNLLFKMSASLGLIESSRAGTRSVWRLKSEKKALST